LNGTELGESGTPILPAVEENKASGEKEPQEGTQLEQELEREI